MIIASVRGKFAPAIACGEKDFEGYLHCHGNKVDSNTFKARIITRYKRMKIRARLRDDESFNNSCKMRVVAVLMTTVIFLSGLDATFMALWKDFKQEEEEEKEVPRDRTQAIAEMPPLIGRNLEFISRVFFFFLDKRPGWIKRNENCYSPRTGPMMGERRLQQKEEEGKEVPRDRTHAIAEMPPLIGAHLKGPFFLPRQETRTDRTQRELLLAKTGPTMGRLH
ncbi:hypothetical protein CDAR_91491 [Caerostris darwini]|uniref:Uncharacterized protein n=1 Tax=Caerostris darwini TaxID=1538125 RepID=A0AAV4WF54_9ARAC|nr:hypothetical protein CDAR_91491 [Caerostris darwini]